MDITIYNNAFWNWVEKHRSLDPTKLRLARKPGDPEWIDDAIAQIENERRSRQKFGGEEFAALVPRLMPVGLSVEQATSARIAALHYAIAGLQPGRASRVLDMTCGLGLDASFLAQNSETLLTALDLNEKIAAVAAWNFKERPNIEVINGDSIEYLRQSAEHFDLIFIDPARRDDAGGRVYNLHDCVPDVTALLPLMLEKSDRVMVKMSPMLDVTQTLRDLPDVRELHVVDERGECRELLGVIDAKPYDSPAIVVHNDETQFRFATGEEAAADAVIAMPTAGQFLLEPSPAMMKAAPFKLICERFDATMIHPNTHLFTTSHYPKEFPGKVYYIDEVAPYSSSNIKRIARQRLSADVAVRNFPVSADALRARLGIRKSGRLRIVGVTAPDTTHHLLFLTTPD